MNRSLVVACRPACLQVYRPEEKEEKMKANQKVELSPFIKELFNLDWYAHRALFEGIEYPWEAISRIEEYIACYKPKWPFGKPDKHSTAVVEGKVVCGKGVKIDALAVIQGIVFIGENTVVEPHATILGPVIIGCNCTIKVGAKILGRVVMGDGCKVGCEASESIFCDEANAWHIGHVGKSVVGSKTNLAFGSCLSNRASGGISEISYSLSDSKVKSGERKFGAIIADGCEINSNSVAFPGSVFSKGVILDALIGFGGHISSYRRTWLESSVKCTPIRSTRKKLQDFEKRQRQRQYTGTLQSRTEGGLDGNGTLQELWQGAQKRWQSLLQTVR